MANIKKTINVFLIAVAIAAVLIPIEWIISFKNLDASPDVGKKTVMQTSVNSTAKVDKVQEYDFKIVINKSLSQPRQDIFAFSPVDDVEDAVKESGKTIVKNDSNRENSAEDEDEATHETAQNQDEDDAASEEEPAVEPAEETGTEKSLGADIDFTISQDFRIEVDLEHQRLTVFHKDEVLREMVCSGGAPESPTPLGEYATTEKIEYAWVERFGVGAYYWIRFFEDYLIHSVPFDENGEMIVEEFEKLGNPASHGCIRLRLEEAKWLYDTLPLGVKIVIY